MTFTKSDTPYGMRFTAFCSMMNLLVILLFTAKLVKKKRYGKFFLQNISYGNKKSSIHSIPIPFGVSRVDAEWLQYLVWNTAVHSMEYSST